MSTANIEDSIEQKVLEQNDTYFSKMGKTRFNILLVISVLFLLFQLYVGIIKPLPALVSAPLHLCFGLFVTFLHMPIAKITGKKWMLLYDIFLYIGIVLTPIYFIINLERLTYRIMMVDKMLFSDLLIAFWMLIIIMEAVRRTIGMNLFIFICVFIAYAFLGQHLVGPLRYSGTTWQQFGEMLLLSSEGMLGTPLLTSLNVLFYFLLFGAFFSNCGGGQVLIDLGMKLGDKTAGGPAKAAVVSSSLMGMISGSAVANVTTTGVLTIPLMKKSGYTAEQSASIEAIASTGGQIMPPIMGVGAFIMAEMIGINYVQIATSAIIPAVSYYVSVFLLVHLIAKKRNLQKLTGNELKYQSEPILPRVYQLLPIIIVVTMIFMGYSLTRSAIFGIVLSIITSMISKKTRMNLEQFINTFLDGIKSASSLAIPTAAVGIMIGIVVRSGVANKLTKIMASIGDINLFLALLIAMIGCILLGMALPTVAAYLIANILFAPTIIAIGVHPLAANMFIFYFGVIAQITPPVCLASFTAAGIAKGNAWKTGWLAFTYAFVAFLTPFVFVFQPSLLLMGTVMETITSAIIMFIGVMFLACGIAGYFFNEIEELWIRIALFIIAVVIIIPETITSIIGLIIGGVFGTILYLRAKKRKNMITV